MPRGDYFQFATSHSMRILAAIVVLFALAVALPGSSRAADDDVRAYVKNQRVLQCFPWLRDYGDRPPVVNHLEYRYRRYVPDFTVDYNNFLKTHRVYRASNQGPENDSEVSYDSHTATILASLGFGEDASETLLITEASPPRYRVYDAAKGVDLATFEINGRLAIGKSEKMLLGMYGAAKTVQHCGMRAYPYVITGPGGSSFDYIVKNHRVLGVVYFGS